MKSKKIAYIHLIDDDPVTQFINKTLLERLAIAENIKLSMGGEEAINYIKDNCEDDNSYPQLMFLDLNMPGIDGFEFLTLLDQLDFKNKSEIRIFILSTSANPKDIEKVKQHASVKKFLNKPLTQEKIHSIIESYFD